MASIIDGPQLINGREGGGAEMLRQRNRKPLTSPKMLSSYLKCKLHLKPGLKKAQQF